MRSHWRWMGGATALLVVSAFFLATRAWSSQLTIPSVSPSDSMLGGNVVALPLNPITALFHNPAQLTQIPNSFTVGALAIPFHPRYANPQGYDNTSRELPLVPNFAYSTDRWAPFSVGFGAYGSLGFSYNFDPDPSRGVPNKFFTELVVISLAPSIAYSFNSHWHLGVSLNPSYGRLRLKSPSPFGRLDIDARGPGVFATAGLLYTPTPSLSLGLSYKTPGAIFMFGNARVAGQGDNTMVTFRVPQSVELGLAYHLTDRLTVVAQARWTDFSVFEETRLDFDHRSFLDRNAVGDARDRIRLGGGIRYALLPGVTFNFGFSWERWAIKANSLSPNLPDNTDYLFPFGFTIERGLWQVDLLGGLSYIESRRVTADRNPFFPGRYALDQPIAGIQFTRKFGGNSEDSATIP